MRSLFHPTTLVDPRWTVLRSRLLDTHRTTVTAMHQVAAASLPGAERPVVEGPGKAGTPPASTPTGFHRSRSVNTGQEGR